MSNRIKGFTVELDKDIKDEDFDQIENAIRMIKHVGSIKRSIASTDDYINRSRIKNEIRSEIWKVFENDF